MKHFVFTVLVLISINSMSAAENLSPGLVFAVNLYSQKVDIRLGQVDAPVFQKLNQAPSSATLLVTVKKPGKYQLAYKESVKTEWLASEQGFPVEAGMSHCIVITATGKAAFYSSVLPAPNMPAICFFNSTSDPVARMEVSVDWSKGIAAYAVQIAPFTITGFQTLPAGYYSLFWQFPEQTDTKAYYAYPDQTGKEYEVFHFLKNNYYLFLAAVNNGSDYAMLFNLSGE